jgi:DNA-binding response OmpR family regulator
MRGGAPAVAALARSGLRAETLVPDEANRGWLHADTRDLTVERERPILVVESDAAIAGSLAEQLTSDGYQVELARTAEHARTRAVWCSPRLVVLGDLESSRAPVELLEEIRRTVGGRTLWAPRLPVIVVGTGVSELDILRAFEAGADDFVARPPRYLELRARIRALLHRVELTALPADRITVGSLEVDMNGHTVSVHDVPVQLRRLEFELLVHLASDPERVFAKQELLCAVWGYRSRGSTRTVDSHASRLRRKLEAHGGRWVINEWGVGYRLR